MSWPMVKFGEVLTFIRGITFKPEEKIEVSHPDAVICMRTKNIQEELDESDLIAVPKSLVKREELFLKHGDILISSANSWNLVGKVVQVPKLDYQATAGGFISILRPVLDKVFPDYLYLFINSEQVQHNIRLLGKKTTNISNLDRKRFLELEIPLPPVSVQERIAEMLMQGEALLKQSIQMTSELNTLAQAVFLEMFGDPLTNSKEWDTKKLRDLGELNRGKSKHRPRNDPSLLGGPYPLIQTGDVARADNYIVNYSSTYSELGLKQSKLWPKGTLCITIAANIADTAILTFDACFPDSVVGFNANANLTSNEFIHYWLKFYQSTLEQLAPESAQKNINLKILEDIDVFVPPLIHQLEFVAILNAIEERKKEARRQNECLYKCFGALMQRAFSGKLDLKNLS